VTSAASLPVVQVSPENRKVVHSCGSQRGSRPHSMPGTSAPCPGRRYGACAGARTAPLSCPDPSPEPDCCRT
jgi:hypothetical protein